jgi:hypothetical protein
VSFRGLHATCGWVAVSCLVGSLSACSEPTQTRVIGTLSGDVGGSATISAPETVTAASPFTVTIITVGSSNCTQVAGEQVTSSAGLVMVVPMDEVPTDGQTCFRDLAPFEHERALRIDVAGQAVLRIVGYFGQGSERTLDSTDVTLQVEP